MVTLLEKAILIAAHTHAGRKDKPGAPYILHPLRGMLRMESEQEMITAVLHDVGEDTECTLAPLQREGFSEDILGALDHLTCRQGEPNTDFLRRVKQNDIARKVKAAYIKDTMNTNRLSLLTQKDHQRLEQYCEAYSLLCTKNSYENGGTKP